MTYRRRVHTSSSALLAASAGVSFTILSVIYYLDGLRTGSAVLVGLAVLLFATTILGTDVEKPTEGGDEEDDEKPEPEVYLKWEEYVEHEIVTQHLMFSGGGERTITFDKDNSFSYGNDRYDYDVPYDPVDFNGEVTAHIEVGDVAHVDLVEKDTVNVEETRSAWVDKDRAREIQDDEEKHNARIDNMRAE